MTPSRDHFSQFSSLITNICLTNDEKVTVLKPEADLACIIAHSMIKEQMYTLSEYFSFINYLDQIEVKEFLKIAEENNILTPIRTHSSLTAFLHKIANKEIPKKLQTILDMIGEDNFEKARLIDSKLETPHKYHPITIAKSLLEISKGSKTQKSMITQVYHMFEHDFAKDFLQRLTNHVFRESY